jgi:hypothetical protein
MGRRRAALDKPFFLPDRYASFALGTHHERGGAFADLEIHVAGRGVSHTVIPEIDEGVLEVVGEVADQVESVRQVLLDRWSHEKLWFQPNLPMELQSYVVQLVERGQLFVHLSFARSDRDQKYKLVKTRWIPPETMLKRHGRDGEYWEQFASWRAYGGDGYSVAGDPADHLRRFDPKEILYLRWPLAEPAGHRAPAQAALELEHATARVAEQGLLRARAGAEPGEYYFAVARARAGAYDDALERQKLLSSRARDLLLYPGTDESEVYGWADSTTEFFAADRLLRSRIAICKLREYIFGEFNSQVIDRWRQMNGWRDIRLTLRPQLYSVADWEALRGELYEGSADLEDVRAAVHAESETARAFNRRWTS